MYKTIKRLNSYVSRSWGRHVLVYRTVIKKNITYPTDAKLHKKIVKKLGLPLRQSYTFVLKDIYRDQRFRNYPKNRKKPSGQTDVYAQ